MPPTILELFSQTGAYLTGHFRLTSGLHSDRFLQSARVLQFPAFAERMGRELAVQLVPPGVICNLVAAPALGGLIIGHEVARALNRRFIFTERDSAGKMSLRRGFTVEPGETAVIVEDVVTTGGSVREVIDLLRTRGVNVIAAGSIIDRTGGKADLGLPRKALEVMETTTWQPEECPLCRQGIPAEKPGSRPTAA